MIFPSSLLIATSLATAALAAPSNIMFQGYQAYLVSNILELYLAFDDFPGTLAGVDVSSYPRTHRFLANS